MKNAHVSAIAAKVAALLSLLFIITANGLSQNESGVRPISVRGFQALGYWYDSSSALYEERYPILRSIPPVNSGMPENVLRSYIYIDSVMRFGIGGETEEQLKGTIDQDIKALAERFYAVTDYDPIAFTQYRIQVSLLSKKYRESLQTFYTQVRENIKRSAVQDARLKQITSILYPDYVLRVQVMAIDSFLKAPELSADGYRYRVTARVLDTLKGRVFRSFIPQLHSDPEIQESTKEPGTYMQFQYTRRNYFDPNDNLSGGPWLYPNRDPDFMTEDGCFKMKVGQEAIVFLSHYQSLFDSTADYLNLMLDLQASFNALPIIDEKVRDVNNVWSTDQVVPYQEWKQIFEAVRGKVATGNY